MAHIKHQTVLGEMFGNEDFDAAGKLPIKEA